MTQDCVRPVMKKGTDCAVGMETRHAAVRFPAWFSRRIFIVLLALAALCAPHDSLLRGAVSQETEGASGPAVVSAGRIAGDGNSVRLFIDLDRKLDFSAFLMADPPRVVIDGPSMLFRFENPDDLNPRGLVSYLRYGAISRSRSRLVVSLARPAEIEDLSVREIGEEGGYRLVVDLAATDEDSFLEEVRRQGEIFGKSGDTARKGDRVRPTPSADGRFIVVLDPGHGGIDGGAKGAQGTIEKEITLAVSKQIAGLLSESGPFDVRLTREEDIFLSLRERVDFARRHKADLVVSVHADSLRQKWVRGASIYTLSKKASDELAAELAASENMADIVAGLDNPVEEDAVSDILADFTARETKTFSRAFSATLVRQLQSEINLIKNPQRSADFVVLKAPEIPGALVELGYLSNPDDEKLMADPRWQAEISRLISEAIVAFFEPRI